MIIDILKYIGRFFVLLLLQVFVLNKIQWNGYLNPFIYILFTMMLPPQSPTWLVLISSFIMGLGVDLFCDTHGLHAFSITTIAYIRRSMLRVISPRESFDMLNMTSISSLGIGLYTWYAVLFVVSHHLLYFYCEAAKFSEFFFTFWRALQSSFFTLVVIFIYQYLFFNHSKR
jgi:rod shape-determining protein MreD